MADGAVLLSDSGSEGGRSPPPPPPQSRRRRRRARPAVSEGGSRDAGRPPRAPGATGEPRYAPAIPHPSPVPNGFAAPKAGEPPQGAPRHPAPHRAGG